MTPRRPNLGVVLMTYGSPRDLDDVEAYVTRIRGGRPPSPELVREFQRRYARIGLSPLIPTTERLAAKLEAELGEGCVARAGMRFSEPSVATAVRALADAGADRVLGVVLSPQYSPIIMGGYPKALAEAAGPLGLPSRVVGAWHDRPDFVAALARRVREALDAEPEGAAMPVLMTAHSLPKPVVDREPDYVEQLKATADLVAEAAGLPAEQWRFAYQSAGHSPEEWLKPDLLDVLPRLAAEGHRRVLVAPVQFLADHLETLYDVDVAGGEQAAEAGIERFARVPALNDAPDFVAVLAALVRDEAARADWRAEAAAA